MQMDLRRWIYALACLLGLAYLATANARGYVPFVSNSTHSSFATANHFHK
jgi:hypothetical protein